MDARKWRLVRITAVAVVSLIVLIMLGVGELWGLAVVALMLPLLWFRLVNEITFDVVPDSWVRDHGSREG